MNIGCVMSSCHVSANINYICYDEKPLLLLVVVVVAVLSAWPIACNKSLTTYLDNICWNYLWCFNGNVVSHLPEEQLGSLKL